MQTNKQKLKKEGEKKINNNNNNNIIIINKHINRINVWFTW